jgi:glycosyltransferase involved in cell wall biosynthesis
MRIIHVMHSHSWGGAESHVVTLARGMRERGHAVMFAGPADSWLTESFNAIDLPTMHLRMNGLLDVRSHWRLRTLARRWKADVVHAHGVRASMYVGHCRGSRDAFSTLATVHSTDSYKHMQRCDQLIAVSDAVRSFLLGHGHAAERVTTVYNGVPDGPHERGPAVRRVIGIDDNEFALCSAGRFVSEKGQDLMVQAVLRCSPNVTLTLIGDAQTPFGREVRALAGGNPRVRFLGFRNDVSTLLPAFDGYLCASHCEAFGLSLAEATAAGLPIIATAVGGIPEVVIDGANGCLVPVNDVAAMAAAIVRLLTNPALSQAQGAAGRLRYLQHFSVHRMVSTTVDLYALAASARSPAQIQMCR